MSTDSSETGTGKTVTGEMGHAHVEDGQGGGPDTSTGDPNLHAAIWGGGLADEVLKHMGKAPTKEAAMKLLGMQDDALRLAHEARAILAFSKSDATSVHSSKTAENRASKLSSLAFVALAVCGSTFPSSVDVSASMPSPVHATPPAHILPNPAVQPVTPTPNPAVQPVTSTPTPALETVGRGTQEQALDALANRIIKMVQDRDRASAPHPARPTSDQPYIGPSFEGMQGAGLVGPPPSHNPGNPGDRFQGRSPQGTQGAIPYIGPSFEAMRDAGLVGDARRQEREMPQTRNLPTVGNPFSNENGTPPFYSLPATRNAVTTYEAGRARQRENGNREHGTQGQAFSYR